MAREREIGICEHRGKEFGYYLIHNGFNDSAYAYCNRCSCSVHLSVLLKNPSGITLSVGSRITQDVEPFLKPCPCGGSFRASAVPRCPHCLQPLSPALAASYIEKNAVGAAKGWRWQRNWEDIYSIVIEDLCVEDWRKEAPSNI